MMDDPGDLTRSFQQTPAFYPIYPEVTFSSCGRLTFWPRGNKSLIHPEATAMALVSQNKTKNFLKKGIKLSQLGNTESCFHPQRVIHVISEKSNERLKLFISKET